MSQRSQANTSSPTHLSLMSLRGVHHAKTSSVAGKRAGLEGGRSGLFYEGIRIINELRKASNGNIQESLFGKMSTEHSTPTKAKTSKPSSKKWLKQGRYSANGVSWMRNTSESHNGVEECSSSLSLILQPQTDVQTRYYLSAKACSGILRRAQRRGKNLPIGSGNSKLNLDRPSSADSHRVSHH
jgi:hypothetical protein